jgi:transcriptional regulator with XRE-family HTH domain
MPQDLTGSNMESQRPSEISDGIFARRLLTLRKTAGLTQEQLADRMTRAGNTMHRSAIAKIEAGDRAVSIGEAVQLAGALGVDLADLASERSRDTEQDRAHRERADVQIRVRSLELEVAERHKQLEEHQFLYEHAVEQLEQAQRELSKWDLRLKVAEQQAQFDKSAWMAGDPDAPDVVKAAWAQEDEQ